MAVTNAGSTPLTFTNLPIGVQVTKITDTSADWASVANSTYFYDKGDGLVHYKNSSGVVLELFSAGGLTYFTEAQATASPNDTVYVDSLTAVASTTNADFAIIPKGTGAILRQIPDGTSTAGNKRGANAVDFQRTRTVNTQVSSGSNSVIMNGVRNTASNTYATVVNGFQNTANAVNSVILNGNCNSASSIQGTILNGTSNTASGYYYSMILNGCSNTASGYVYSTIISGNLNNSTGCHSLVVNGRGNVSSGSYSSVLNGCGNTASATYSTVLNGKGNTASGIYSISSGAFSSTQSVIGRISHASGRFSVNGDSQISTFVLRRATTNNTPTTLTSDSNAASATNQVILSNNSSYRFTGTIIGKQSGSVNTASWAIDGLIVRGANAAATTLNVSNVNVVQNTPAWGTPTLTADTTNGGLQVQVIGAAATNIRWTAVIETTEVIYA